MTSSSDSIGLAERAGALRARIAQLANADAIAKNQQALRTRHGQFTERVAPLVAFAGVRRRFNEAGIPVSLPTDPIRELLQTSRKRRIAFEADPASIADDPANSTFNYGFLVPLQSQAGYIRGRLEEAWRSYLVAPLGGLDEELLRILGQVPGLEAAVVDIQNASARLRQLAETLPQDEAAVVRAQELMRDLRARWEALPTAEIAPEVLDFLRDAVMQTGAPLTSLNATVRNWLEAHGLLTNLRVRFSGRP